jgi:hypothetical protein
VTATVEQRLAFVRWSMIEGYAQFSEHTTSADVVAEHDCVYDPDGFCMHRDGWACPPREAARIVAEHAAHAERVGRCRACGELQDTPSCELREHWLPPCSC